ncbi:MAG: amino acid transporter, AAT family, partial [Elusimicrobia bacterium]
GFEGFFPAGAAAVPLSMVLVLVNFQGTELIALSAAEAENPRESIKAATRKVAVRIVAIFVIPLLVLVSVFPYAEGSVNQSVFAAALERSGFRLIAALFTFVALSAALSCANSGLYGTVRALYGLGKEGLAPAWVTRLSAAGVPHLATGATILTCWLFLPLYVLFEGTSFYVWLLSVSGFTGAVCWLSISWCRLRFRKERGGNLWPDRAAIALQLACLGLIPFNKDLRGCLLIGIPAVLAPMAAVWWRRRPRAIGCSAAGIPS